MENDHLSDINFENVEVDVTGFIMYDVVYDKNEKRNREVLLVPPVEKTKGKRKFNFKACIIEDANFIIHKHQCEIIRKFENKDMNFLKRSHPRTYKHKSFNMALAKMLKINYRQHNNVCILYFEKFNQNKSKITAYAYCSHLTCNSYKFNIQIERDIMVVKCFRNNLPMVTHPYGVQLTGQIRNIDRIIMMKSLMNRTGSDLQTEMDFNLSEDLCNAGTVNSKHRKLLDKVRSEFLRALLRDRDQALDLLSMSNSNSEIERVTFFPLTVIIVMHKLIELLRSNQFDKTIHIDATGSVVKFSKASTKILVYDLLVRHTKKKMNLSLSHLISETHKAIDIENWLQVVKYVAETASKKITDLIKRVVTDWSYALMLGEFI